MGTYLCVSTIFIIVEIFVTTRLHAPLKLEWKCYLKFIQWKSGIFSNLGYNSVSNNLILCYIGF